MKYLKRISFILAALVTLVALFYAVENWRGTRDYQKVMQQLEKEGEELDFAKLTPKIVPEGENFGSATFLQELEQEGVPGSLQATMEAVYESIRQVEESETNAEFLEIAQGLVEESGGEMEPLEFMGHALEPWQAVRQDLVERLPLTYAQWNKTVESGQQADVYAALNISSMFVMKLTGIQARVHLLEGKSEAALEDILIGLRLGEMYEQEPGLIFHVTFLATLALMGEPIKEGLRMHAFSAEQLDRLDQSLRKIDFANILQFAMRGERAFAITFTETAPKALLGEGEASWLAWAPKGWALRGFGALAEAYQQSVEIFGSTDLPLGTQRQAWHRLWERHQSVRATEWTAALGAGKLSGVIDASVDTARAFAVHRAAIEIYKFKIAHGHYPEELGELHCDPLDEQPLLYQREGDGYRIETRNDPEGFPIRFESH